MSRNSSMASLRALVFGPAADRAKPRRRALRPEVGALEERVVQTVFFNPVFGAEQLQPSTNKSGQYTVLNRPTVELIFWGGPDAANTPKTPSTNYWSTPAGQAQKDQFINDVRSMLGGPYLSGLKQYGSDGTAVLGSTWVDTSAKPPAGFDPGNSATTSTIQQEIQRAIDTPGSGIHAPGSNSPIYVVVTAPVNSATNGGYNVNGVYKLPNSSKTSPIHMISMGSVFNGRDLMSSIFSHEIVERMSDPTGDTRGVTVKPPSTLPTGLGTGLSQIADLEPEPAGQPHYQYSLNGVMVQPYWSAADRGFIVPDAPWTANQHRTYLGPQWSNTTSTTPMFSGFYHAFSTEVTDVRGNVFGLVAETGKVYELVQANWVQVGSGITSLVSDGVNVYSLNPTGPGYVYQHNLDTGWSWNTVATGISTLLTEGGRRVFTLNPTTGIVSQRNANGGWDVVGNGITQLVSDAAGMVYGLNPTGPGYVYQHNVNAGWSWTTVGSGITQLVSDAYGMVYSLNPTGPGYVYQHNLNTGWSWSTVGSGMTQLVSDLTGNVFALNPTGPGYVYQHNLNTGWSWNVMGSGMTQLVSDLTGNIFALNPTGPGYIYQHNVNTGWNWDIVGSGITQLVSDVTKNVYSINPTGPGYIYQHNVNTGWSWNTVGTGYTRLVSDVVGNVYGLNPTSGYVYQHKLNGGTTWSLVGTGFTNLVSDVLGNIFALNSTAPGYVYQHDVNGGTSWTQVYVGAASLSSDVVGNVFVVTSTGIRYKHVLGAGASWVQA